MKRIEKFQADDGSVWDTEGEALRRDNLRRAIADAEALLLERPSDHGTHVQQTEGACREFKRRIVALAKVHCPNGIWDQPVDEIGAFVFAGRYLDDSGPLPLYEAWLRIMCFDSKYREWGQPVFALRADGEEV